MICSPIPCTLGYYNPNTGATSCSTLCPAGLACPLPSYNITCEKGYYSYAGSTTCTRCPPGS